MPYWRCPLPAQPMLDTSATATSVASAAVSADTGASTTDFITRTAQQAVRGTLSANLATGETVQVLRDNGALWSVAAAVGSNAWTLAGQTPFQYRPSPPLRPWASPRLAVRDQWQHPVSRQHTQQWLESMAGAGTIRVDASRETAHAGDAGDAGDNTITASLGLACYGPPRRVSRRNWGFAAALAPTTEARVTRTQLPKAARAFTAVSGKSLNTASTPSR